MSVALSIEALLMGAKSGYPAFDLFAKSTSGNRQLARCLRDCNRRFELFNFDYGGRGGFSLRVRFRLLPGNRLHKCHCLRD